MPDERITKQLMNASLEDVLNKLYPAVFLKWIYEASLKRVAQDHSGILPQLNASQRYGKAQDPRKTYLVQLLLAVFRNLQQAAFDLARLVVDGPLERADDRIDPEGIPGEEVTRARVHAQGRFDCLAGNNGGAKYDQNDECDDQQGLVHCQSLRIFGKRNDSTV